MKGPDTYVEGRPSWVDLATPDIDAAKEFYTALFGWEYDARYAAGGGGYFLATSGGHVVAGIAKAQDPELSPVWSTYLAVASADAAAERVSAAGGSVLVEPMTVGPAGRMAYFADPDGAAFGVWEGDDHDGAARINEPGAFTWAELHATNADGVVAFYNEVFGLKAQPEDFGPEVPAYATFRAGETVVAGTMAPPSEHSPHHWHVFFGAADADAAAASAVDAGGQLLGGPFDTPVGRMATLRDPQGAAFSVIALTEWPE